MSTQKARSAQQQVQEPPPDPSWLRAQRTAIFSRQDLTEFGGNLQRLTDDLEQRPGHGIGRAVVWTVAAVVVAALVMLVGVVLINFGQAMWEWLNE